MVRTRASIVCLCGSTRFLETFREAYIRETIAGKVVLTVVGNFRDHPDFEKIKPMLDKMYLRKIDLANEILVINVGGYIGESTQREIDYARAHGKKIRWWEHG